MQNQDTHFPSCICRSFLSCTTTIPLGPTCRSRLYLLGLAVRPSVLTVSLCFLFRFSHYSFVPLSTLKVPLHPLFLCPSRHTQSPFVPTILQSLWTHSKSLRAHCSSVPLDTLSQSSFIPTVPLFLFSVCSCGFTASYPFLSQQGAWPLAGIISHWEERNQLRCGNLYDNQGVFPEGRYQQSSVYLVWLTESA